LNKRNKNRKSKKSYTSRILLLILLFVISVLYLNSLKKEKMSITPASFTGEDVERISHSFETALHRSLKEFNLLKDDVTRKTRIKGNREYGRYEIMLHPAFSLFKINEVITRVAGRTDLSLLQGIEKLSADGKQMLFLQYGTGGILLYEFLIQIRQRNPDGYVPANIILVFEGLGRNFGPVTRQILRFDVPVACIIFPEYTASVRIAEEIHSKGFEVLSNMTRPFSDALQNGRSTAQALNDLTDNGGNTGYMPIPHAKGFAVPDSVLTYLQQDIRDSGVSRSIVSRGFFLLGNGQGVERQRRALIADLIPFWFPHVYTKSGCSAADVSKNLEALHAIAQSKNYAIGVFAPTMNIVQAVQHAVAAFEKKGVRFITFSSLLF
jgi:hypothetical protein